MGRQAVKSDTPVKVERLPFNGTVVSDRGFSFSFACFDRTHKLFNLGGDGETGTVSSGWFIDLLDCLKSVSNMSIQDMKRSMHDLHPINWSRANASTPDGQMQADYWQFRVNKSKGRVIGFLIDGVFYVVWLDPHHNLTDSEGYGTVRIYNAGLSDYERLQAEVESGKEEILRLRDEIAEYEKILDDL